MSDAHFQIVYDGEAVREGEMDVRSLAPALLSVGDLLQEANTILNGNRAEVSVKVRAGFKPGSFEIDLKLIQDLYEQTKQLVLSQNVADAKELLERVFFFVGIPVTGGAGLFKLIRALKKRTPERVTYNDNRVQLVIGSDVIEAHQDAYRLYLDDKIRQAVDGVVKPVETQGIDFVEARYGDEKERITKEDSSAFVSKQSIGSPSASPDLANSREALLRVIKLSFMPKQKWRFSDGAATFNAAITDKGFLSRLEARQEGFYSGDVLRVILSFEQAMNPSGGITSNYKVEKVLEHLPKAQQITMFSEIKTPEIKPPKATLEPPKSDQ